MLTGKQKLKVWVEICYVLFTFSLGVTLPFAIVDDRAQILLSVPCFFAVLGILLAIIYAITKNNTYGRNKEPISG